MSNIPAKYTDPLLAEPDLAVMTFQLEHYDGHCMNSTRIMMDFLIVRSSATESGLRESLMPVLTVMTKFARHHRYIFTVGETRKVNMWFGGQGAKDPARVPLKNFALVSVTGYFIFSMNGCQLELSRKATCHIITWGIVLPIEQFFMWIRDLSKK